MTGATIPAPISAHFSRPSRLKVLFLARGTADLRVVESTLHLLGEHGADVRIVSEPNQPESDDLVKQLCRQHSHLHCSAAPVVPFTAWSFMGGELLRAIECLASLKQLPPEFLRPALRSSLGMSRTGRRLLGRTLQWCERAVPREVIVDAFIRAESPDLVLSTPLGEPGSTHADCIRSARALGVRTVVVGDGNGDARERLVAALNGTPEHAGVPRGGTPWWGPIVRPVLARAALRLASTAAAQRTRALRQENVRNRLDTERAAHRATLVGAKQRAVQERQARRKQQAVRREEVRLAHERAIDTAYANYLQVRSWAGRMRETCGCAAEALGKAEQQMVAGLAPLWNADRETIATLRRWCEPIGGAPAAEYEPPSEELTGRLRRQVDILRKQNGADLFVQEPTTLGRFGVRIGDELHNEDTVKFFLATAALNDGAVLAPFRSATGRRVVWEIGGGWGGFAFHFKTLCPNTTYLITGIPDVLLVSAVYLMSAFPDARCRFYDREGSDDPWHDWEHVDFVFAPEGAEAGYRPPRLDLTLDIGTLRHMGPLRVAAHVQQAFEWGSPYFYSMLPAFAVDDPSTPWTIVERHYWPHPVPLRAVSSVYALLVPPEANFRHLVGWRRMRT